MACAIILLPANLAFSAPTYLGSEPSAEADSVKFTQKVNIILAQNSTQVPLSIRYGGTEARGGFVLMQREHLIFVKTLLLAPSFFLLPLFSWLLTPDS